MARDDEDDDNEVEEDLEQVLFQGALYGREANLKKNPRLVQAGLVPVKRMVSDGLSRHAHTILLEPGPGRIAIRFVVDGIPYPAGAVPGQRGNAMIQMVKLLAGLNPQERSEEQTGGINAEYEGTRYRLLVKSTPLKPGVERLRIRVENPKVSYIRPADMGVPDAFRSRIKEMSEGRGIILVCGPPESGVTSLSLMTLHCVDSYLYSVFTVVDAGDNQLINVTDYKKLEKVDEFDLEIALDRIIRREADIVYTGKFDDPKATQLLFDYSDRLCFFGEIAGNTPIDALQTLIEWVGVDAVVKGLRGIVTQKLIRTLCDDCKQAFRPNPQLLRRLGLPPETSVLYRAPAPPPEDDPEAPTIEELCEDCDGMPYRGRTAVYEVLEMTDGMKEVVAGGADPAEIRRQMGEDNMQTLQKDALRLVVEGKTSLEEVQRSFAPAKARPRKRRPRP